MGRQYRLGRWVSYFRQTVTHITPPSAVDARWQEPSPAAWVRGVFHTSKAQRHQGNARQERQLQPANVVIFNAVGFPG